MTSYKKIPIWENKRRAARLLEFRCFVQNYFNTLHDTSHGGNILAAQHRQSINLILAETRKIIAAADIATKARWSHGSFMVGFKVGTVDALEDIFNFPEEIAGKMVNHVFDVLDRAIGVYSADQRSAWWRTVNPFWWIGQALSYLSHMPFVLIGAAGFNATKVERSRVGRIGKVIMSTILALAAFLAVLHYLGLLDAFKTILGFAA